MAGSCVGICLADCEGRLPCKNSSSVDVGSSRGRSGVDAGSIRGQSGVDLGGSIRGRPGAESEPIRSRRESNFASTCNRAPWPAPPSRMAVLRLRHGRRCVGRLPRHRQYRRHKAAATAAAKGNVDNRPEDKADASATGHASATSPEARCTRAVEELPGGGTSAHRLSRRAWMSGLGWVVRKWGACGAPPSPLLPHGSPPHRRCMCCGDRMGCPDHMGCGHSMGCGHPADFGEPMGF